MMGSFFPAIHRPCFLGRLHRRQPFVLQLPQRHIGVGEDRKSVV